MRTLTARRSHLAVLGLAGALAACELPSDPPIFQQTWIVPTDSVTVGVSQILPANIAPSGGNAFAVTIPAPTVFSTTLGTLCGQPACQSVGTVNAPVPAFTSTGAQLQRVVNFPATVASATVTGGTLSLSVNNQLGFDPLRPNGAGAPFGSLTVTITNGATNTNTVLGGATQALATGATTVLNIPIPAGTYAGSLTVSVAMNVPAGQNANLAASNSILVTPSVNNLLVSSASVVVQNDSVNTAPSDFDLSDVDFQDQVAGGGVILDVVNPFTAGAALTLRITAPAQAGQPAVNIAKPLTITATPTSTVNITLTQPELQSLLGKSNVQMSVIGTANGTGAGNTVTVAPNQVITLRTKVQLLLNVGG